MDKTVLPNRPTSCVCAGFNPNAMAIGSACFGKAGDSGYSGECDPPGLDLGPNPDCSRTLGTSGPDSTALFVGGRNVCYMRNWTPWLRGLQNDATGSLRDPYLPFCRSVPCVPPRFYSFGGQGSWNLKDAGSDFWRTGLCMWMVRALDREDHSVCLQNVGTLGYLGSVDAPKPPVPSRPFQPMPTSADEGMKLGFGLAPMYPGAYSDTACATYCLSQSTHGTEACPAVGALNCAMKARLYTLPPYARRNKWVHYKTGAVRWIPMTAPFAANGQGTLFKNVRTGEYLQLMTSDPINSVLTTGTSTTFAGASFQATYLSISELPSGHCAPCGTPLSVAEHQAFLLAFSRRVFQIPLSVAEPSQAETDARWEPMLGLAHLDAPDADSAPALLALGPGSYPTGAGGATQSLTSAIGQVYGATSEDILAQINHTETLVAKQHNARLGVLTIGDGNIADTYQEWARGNIDPPPKIILSKTERTKVFGAGPRPATALTFLYMSYMKSQVRAFSDCYGPTGKAGEIPDRREAAIAWATEKLSAPIHTLPIAAVPYAMMGEDMVHTACIVESNPTLGTSWRRPLTDKLLYGCRNVDTRRACGGGEWVAGTGTPTLTLTWHKPIPVSRIQVRLYNHPETCLYGQEACGVEIWGSLQGKNVDMTGKGRTIAQYLNTDCTVSPMPLWYDALNCQWFFDNTVCALTWKCPKQSDPSLLSWWMFPQIGQGTGNKIPQHHPSKGPPNWGPPSTGAQQEEFSQGSFYGYICRTIEGSFPAWLMASQNSNPRTPSRNCPGQQPSPPPPCCEIPGGDVYVIAETENKVVANFAPCHWWMRPEENTQSGEQQWYRLLTITDADCDPHEPTNKKCYYDAQPLGPTTRWMALTLRDEATLRPDGAQSIADPPKFVDPFSGAYFSADVFPWVLSSPATTSSGWPAKSPLTCQWLAQNDVASDRQLFRWIEGSPWFPNCRILECKAFPFRPLGELASLPWPDPQDIWQSGSEDVAVDTLVVRFTPRLGENPIGTSIPPLRVRSLHVQSGNPTALPGFNQKIGIVDQGGSKTKLVYPYKLDGIGSAFSNCVKVHSGHDPGSNNRADSTYPAVQVDVARSELRRLGNAPGRMFSCVLDYDVSDGEEDDDVVADGARAAGDTQATGQTPVAVHAPIPANQGVGMGAVAGAGADLQGNVEGAFNWAPFNGQAVVPAQQDPAPVLGALAGTQNVDGDTQHVLHAVAEGNAVIAAVAGEGGPAANDEMAVDDLAAHAQQLSDDPGYYADEDEEEEDLVATDPVNPEGAAQEGDGYRQSIRDTVTNFFGVSLHSFFGSLVDIQQGGGAAAAPGVPGAPVNPESAWSVIVQLAMFAGMMANAHNVVLGMVHEIREFLDDAEQHILAAHPNFTVAQARALFRGMQNALPYTNFLVNPQTEAGAQLSPGVAQAGRPLATDGTAHEGGGAAAAVPQGQALREYFHDMRQAVGAQIDHASEQARRWTGILSFMLSVLTLAADNALQRQVEANANQQGIAPDEWAPQNNPLTPPNFGDVVGAVAEAEGRIRDNSALNFPPAARPHFFLGVPVGAAPGDPNTYLHANQDMWRVMQLGLAPTHHGGPRHIGMAPYDRDGSGRWGFRFPVYGDPYAFIQYRDYAEGAPYTSDEFREATEDTTLSGLLNRGVGTWAELPPEDPPAPQPLPAIDVEDPMGQAVQELMGIGAWIHNNAQGFLDLPASLNPVLADRLELMTGPIQQYFQSYDLDTNVYNGGNSQDPTEQTEGFGFWNGFVSPGLRPPPGYGQTDHMTPPPFLTLMAGMWHEYVVGGITNIFRLPIPPNAECDQGAHDGMPMPPPGSFFSATAPGHGGMPAAGADSLNGILTFMLALAANIAAPFHSASRDR